MRLICDVSITVNWWSVVMVLPTALATAVAARMWSGSLDHRGQGMEP